MASVSFEHAIEYLDPMTIISPENKEYKGYYSDPKIDRSTLPKGWYSYDFRHDDYGLGLFVELSHNYVFVNNCGSFFTDTPIAELSKENSCVYMKVDPEEVELLNQDRDKDTEPYEFVNNPDDWDYIFSDITSPIIIIDKEKFESYNRR